MLSSLKRLLQLFFSGATPTLPKEVEQARGLLKKAGMRTGEIKNTIQMINLIATPSDPAYLELAQKAALDYQAGRNEMAVW